MLNKSVLALFALLVMFGVSSAGDLYYVSVQSSDEALQLRQVGVDPVMRLKGGYLVLIDDSRAEILAEAALDARLVATDVERDQLAVDGRFDRQNVDKYNLIFEEDNLKLYKLDVGQPGLAGIVPLHPAGFLPPGGRRTDQHRRS